MTPVQAGVIFKKDGFYPTWFILNQYRYKIDKVTYKWKQKDGSITYTHFAVMAGGNLFELALDHSTMKWFIRDDTDE